MDDYDVYYVDGRNAYRDPRTGRMVGYGTGAPYGYGPSSMTGRQPYGQSPMIGQAPYGMQGWGQGFGPQGPGSWGPNQNAWGPHGPGYAQMQGPFGSSLLGRISTGQLIDLIAQVFAALNPLPAQPVATSDPSTDVGNLILYQGALASYAKKDEQIRTLGHLVGKLV
jgi:hypothetical protein